MNQEAFVVPNNVAAFVLKLWKLVEDTNVDDMISWSKGGTAFCVHDPVSFAREVLPHYFKHNNFTSFVRQLNMYGFKKVISTDHGGIKSENPEWEFHHQYFVQGKLEWLELVKRKVHPEEKKVKTEEVSHILDDVQQLRAKHGIVESQFESLKMQNEMLWQEVSDLRIKHRKQQHVLNKLIKFLLLVYGGKGIGNRKRLAIESGQSSSKRRRTPQQAQIEELESLKYVVESPKPSEDLISQLETEPSTAGPQITLLPDEPLVQEFPSASVARKQQLNTATAKEAKSSRKANGAGGQKNSKKSNDASLKLKIPTMVQLSKEPALDFSPSIFANVGQIFPTDTNVSNAAVNETLEELENSFNPVNAVVLKRPLSTEKEYIDHDVDHITNSLDSLQHLLSGPQFNLDTNTLNQLFNPDESLPAASSVPFAITGDADKSQSLDSEDSSVIDGEDGLPPFSPGMFLNDVGEPSNDEPEKEIDLENSLL